MGFKLLIILPLHTEMFEHVPAYELPALSLNNESAFETLCLLACFINVFFWLIV